MTLYHSLRSLWALPVIGLAQLGQLAYATSSINVGLQASFNAPPYLLELLETAAEENSTAYFPLLDRIADGRFLEYTTDEELYNEFLDVLRKDGHITNDAALSSFQLGLSIHSAAPRIEAHYQYYNTSVEHSLMVAQDAACPVWVHIGTEQYCSSTLERAQQNIGPIKHVEPLPFDRVLGESSQDGSTPSILYADITSPLFAQFHNTIKQTAETGQSSYRVRYRPSSAQPRKPLAVSGYGVELTLKRTDYIVIDDRASDAAEDTTEDRPEEMMESSTDGDREAVLGSLDEEINDLRPLTATELSGLGLKATSFIMASQDPFDTLIKVSQDFPKHSSILSKWNISREVRIEHRKNRDIWMPAGYNVVWMNGQQVQAREMDIFALREKMRNERALVGNLEHLGFSGAEAIQMISHVLVTESAAAEQTTRYDYRDDLENNEVIIWLNDIEKDKRYENWPSDLATLLQRTWPGQLPQVRRDIHNVVVPVDFSNIEDVEMVVETLQAVVKRKIPIRFGIVPTSTTPGAVSQAMMVYHLCGTYGLSAMFTYLQASLDNKSISMAEESAFSRAVGDRKAKTDRAIMSFEQMQIGLKEFVDQTEISADAVHKEVLSHLQRSKSYLRRLAAESVPAPVFVNGVAMARNEAWLQTMSLQIDADLRLIQKQIFEMTMQEDTAVSSTFIEGAATTRNALIIPEDETTIEILDVANLWQDQAVTSGGLPTLLVDVEAIGLERFAPHLIVVANLDSIEGSTLLSEAMIFWRANKDVEIVIIHNAIESQVGPISTRLYLQKQKLGQNLKVEDMLYVTESDEMPGIETIAEAVSYWSEYRNLLSKLKLSHGQNALFLNGRMVGPVPKETAFTHREFEDLLQYERTKRISPAEQVLSAMGLHDRIASAIQGAAISSMIALSAVSDIPEGIFEASPTIRMDKFNTWQSQHTVIETGEADSSSINFVASIDPTSPIAQRWIHILHALSKLKGVHVKIFLNPRDRITELPIKRFYRHVLDAAPTFAANGTVQDLAATFKGVPKEALLNLGLEVPPAWLVAPKDSIHDLDNIKLSALKDGANVDATYELEYILIEGHSRDVSAGQGQPPRGVQLVLGTGKEQHAADTIIMANLGYFQFKANPGYWNLQLQDGRSSAIFSIDSAGQAGYNPTIGDTSTDITLMSFQGRTLYPRLSRKPGHEEDDVLEEKSASILDAVGQGSMVHRAGKLASSVLSKVGLSISKTQHADINIFSVASGHLYERMLSIMMVSVMRHTERSVKFWFISQFLSPSFKASLPDLAAHYNFDFELVTYKWPHWLRAQTEKQREIWGYKILFLDVLFPTSLDKVIFVDADQIVRTDMYSLIQLDLEGAPYGFTPMCDSRTEMEGFRFWKQGYWANFLRGLPYHISALYVVDLVKFREIAAGDRLRGQYHQLSADPGSLSNLDQDLPNHMQHVLKIKSLPQDWLWCETWCSDAALSTAKTIDLCNNPQTKEPKLKRARRQVPEWTVYDDEIADVLAKAKSSSTAARGGGVQEVMIEGTVVSDDANAAMDDAPKSKEEGRSIKDEL